MKKKNLVKYQHLLTRAGYSLLDFREELIRNLGDIAEYQKPPEPS